MDNNEFIRQLLDDNDHDPFLVELANRIGDYEDRINSSNSQLNQIELNKLKTSYLLIKKIFYGQKANIKCALFKPSKTCGVIEVTGRVLRIKDIQQFLTVTSLAGSIQFVPHGNNISITIMFPRLLEVRHGI